ncbi:uncharacterized protein LOC135205557 [Macrobrachium nipponense]|uniref:uncharacterized protein LOC135205557 n=1 Tax=Macrobrachium nipponense TaxID=159736 RepID=UPI0030C88ACC
MCAVEPPVACGEHNPLSSAPNNCCPNPIDVHTQKQVLAFRRLYQSMLKKPTSVTTQAPLPSEGDADDCILTANTTDDLISLSVECWKRPLVSQKYVVNVNGYRQETNRSANYGGLNLSARILTEREENGLTENRSEMQNCNHQQYNKLCIGQEDLIKGATPCRYNAGRNRGWYGKEGNNLSTKNIVNTANSGLSFDEKFYHNEAMKEGVLILGPLYEGTREEELQNERNKERISYENGQDDRTWVKVVRGEMIDRINWQSGRQNTAVEKKVTPSSNTDRSGRLHSENSHGAWIQEANEYTRFEHAISNEKEYNKFSHCPTADQQLCCQLQEYTEHKHCLKTPQIRKEPVAGRSKLELEEKGLELHLHHYLRHDNYTSQNRINSIQQSHYGVGPEPLSHSWSNPQSNISRKKTKTLGRKVLGRIGELKEMKLLGIFQDFEPKECSQRVVLGTNTTKLWNIGERGRKIVNDCHKKLTEKIPSHFTVSKPKRETSPNAIPFGVKQQYKCFFISSEQYWECDSISPNAVYRESFKISQDRNNNCSDWHLQKDLNDLFFGIPQQKIQRSSKKLCNIQYILTNADYSKSQNEPSLKKRFANFMMKMKYFYSIYKYSGYKKMKIENLFTANQTEKTPGKTDRNLSDACTIRGYINRNILGKSVPTEQDADQGQSGDGGRRQWEKSKSNKENNFAANDDDASTDDKGGSERTSASVHPVVKPTKNLHRSFDVDYRGRQRKPKSQKVFQRSISSDEDKCYGAIADTVKYRDKDFPTRLNVSDSSNNSNDPTDCLKGIVNKRLSKSHERKRTSLRNKKDFVSDLHSRDAGHSRRKYAKAKSDQSTSSQSSSSSSSSSRARSGTKPAHRLKRKSVPKETVQTDQPLKAAGNYDEQYDQSQFLARLDSVLSDLVENEKKKISKYGQLKFKEMKHVNSEEFMSTKPSLKKEVGHQSRKKSSPEVNPSINPSVQQLRATLRAVRVRKRTPLASDLLDKHAERFTERLPHNPRILKSQVSSQLLAQRCYQPPKRKPSHDDQNNATADYASDFYSSDEDHGELQAVCQKDLPSIDTKPKKYQENFEETDAATDEKDENDTCSGSDNPITKRYALNTRKKIQETIYKPHHGEVGDSGDFSVDSAYTGSRGATPENVLTPTVKCRSLGGSLTTALPAMRFYSSYRNMPRSERLIELKRSILYDIKQSKLYSDESINSLLEEYKRKCCDVSSTDVQEVILSVQEDLGVKPRPDYYICHLLQSADERRQGEFGSNLTTDTANPETHSHCTTVEDPYASKVPNCPKDEIAKGSNGRLKHDDSKQELTESPKISRKSEGRERSVAPKTKGSQRKPRSREEKEDKAWAEAALGDVAPSIVAEAAQAQVEAKSNTDDSDQDWSGYVTDLCQQFDIKI